jgi:hypothetical protein
MPIQLSRRSDSYPPANWRGELVRLWRSLCSECFDRYRPELHYMRGRGPRWYEKHGPHFG